MTLIVGGIFCDLTKAFYCVNCDILCSELNFYAVTGKANEWIKLCFTNRYKIVEIKSKTFDNINTFLTCGGIKHIVSKGSVLGLLFFLLYIHDLSVSVNKKSESILLADVN
jgi:hypothetical protein